MSELSALGALDDQSNLESQGRWVALSALSIIKTLVDLGHFNSE